MRLYYACAGLAFIIGFGAAQSTTVSLFLPNTDPQSLVASVIGTDATATTYLISCPSGTDGSNCGYGGGATVVEGPATLQIVIAGESIACSLAGTTQAVCTQSQTLSGYSTTELVTSTLGPADITYFPVGVTAGADRLGPASASASASASVTGTSSGGMGSASTTTSGIVGSTSMAISSSTASGPATTTSTAEEISTSSTTTSISSTITTLSMSQTRTASPSATSAKSAASRVGKGQVSFPAAAVRCLLVGVLAITLL